MNILKIIEILWLNLYEPLKRIAGLVLVRLRNSYSTLTCWTHSDSPFYGKLEDFHSLNSNKKCDLLLHMGIG